jgi:two-component system sensor histidine kinase HydH
MLIQHQATDHSITIEKHLPENSPLARLDSDKISQVLLNLYLNAIEAMKNNNNKKMLSISVSNLTEKDKIEIRISDTGSGMDSKILSRIFDPFFTTRSSGTGLGLSIVYNIMEAHGGDIRVESKSGEGCTILLRLPLEDIK